MQAFAHGSRRLGPQVEVSRAPRVGALRKRLQKLDLEDLVPERPPVNRRRLTARLRALLATERARTVARNCFRSLPKTCEKVLRKRGAASGA